MSRRTAPLVAILLIVVATSQVRAEPLPQGFEMTGTATVVSVVDGDTIGLADGRQVRLVGLQAPKLSLGRADVVDWPLADTARDTLAEVVLEREIALAYGGRAVDRHGRALAHVVRVEDGLWIQGAMLEAGMARVYSFPDNRTGVRRLQEIEAAARAARRGIWNVAFYAPLMAEAPADIADGFHLVEGVVAAAERVRDSLYLNFGSDWRRDFTVVIAAADLDIFAAANIDPLALTGRRMRVRGWISQRNGPMIVASHPEQIEILSDR